ncbi:MAG: hypothetical protein RLZZ343_1121, partial [Actinomycetota bacterium]
MGSVDNLAAVCDGEKHGLIAQLDDLGWAM